jgi:hypothetical protein
MIGECTYSELTDMHFMFAGAYGSTLQAQRLYQEHFPDRRVPDRKSFSGTNHYLFYNCNAITKN